MESDLTKLTDQEIIERQQLQDEHTIKTDCDESFIDYLNYNLIETNTEKHNTSMTQYILEASRAAGKALKFKHSKSKI